MSENATVTAKHPLGLPRGSVRAILTLAILATVWFLVFKNRFLNDELEQALLMVLSYYFAMRKKNEPHTPTNEVPPLGLPSGSIRTIIILGFGTLVYFLYKENRLLDNKALPVIILVIGFFIGYFGKAIMKRWANRFTENPLVAFARHAKALVTIAITAAYCIAIATGHQDSLPPQTSKAFLGILGFYFGYR